MITGDSRNDVFILDQFINGLTGINNFPNTTIKVGDPADDCSNILCENGETESCGSAYDCDLDGSTGENCIHGVCNTGGASYYSGGNLPTNT